MITYTHDFGQFMPRSDARNGDAGLFVTGWTSVDVLERAANLAVAYPNWPFTMIMKWRPSTPEEEIDSGYGPWQRESGRRCAGTGLPTSCCECYDYAARGSTLSADEIKDIMIQRYRLFWHEREQAWYSNEQEAWS